MNVAVTGATGFLGKRLVKQLLDAGMQVHCLVRPTSDVDALRAFVGEQQWARVRCQPIDLMDTEACTVALEHCDVLYHAAAALTGSTSTLVLETVLPTRRLIAAALAARVTRFVLVGSFGVYGAAALKPGSTLDENSPMEPAPHRRDAYSYSKIKQEQVALQAHRDHQLPLVIVRPGVIYGPGKGALSSRVGLPLGNVTLRMDGGQTLPYVYVDNCAEAIYLAGVVPGIEGEIFNVLDDDLPTGKQILKMYADAGDKRRWIWLPRPLLGPVSGLYEWYHHYSNGQLPGVISRYKTASMWKRLNYTNQKAKQRLNWQPRIGFSDAFARSIGKRDA